MLLKIDWILGTIVISPKDETIKAKKDCMTVGGRA